MTHRVDIGQLHTACRFQAEPARAELLRKAVDHSCRDRLPEALRRALEPVLEGHDGVIRVRALQLELTTGDPNAPDLAEQIAQRLALIVRALLRGGGDGVMHWPDHNAFMAHYVLWRLGLRAGADWAFADFKALEYLSPQQAVVELLASRPEVLGAIAHDPVLQDAPHVFARLLSQDVQLQLLQRLLHPAAQTAAQPVGTALLNTALPQLLRQALSDPSPAALLTRLLQLLTRLPDDGAHRSELDIADLTRLIALLTALAQLPRAVLQTIGPQTRWQALLTSRPLRTLPQHLLQTLQERVANADDRALLVRLAQALAHAESPKAAPRDTDAAAAALHSCQSDFAGLALLIAPLLHLQGAHAPDAAQRRAIALACLPDETHESAARDPGFNLLFPKPRPGTAAPWPSPDPVRLGALRAGPSSGLISAEAGAALWSQAVLARFAACLPGLAQSSVPYLQNQFLCLGGDMLRDNAEITVTLAQVPLGIVLRMGGLLGDQTHLPWHDNRLLRIALAEGRR